MGTREKIEISGNHALKALLLLSGLWALCYYGANLLLPVLVSALIATLLNKLTEKFKKWGFPN